MKFLCDRCKTRYSIGDDRVRGKILKIRCKNCANVITVREGMMVDPEAAPIALDQPRGKATSGSPDVGNEAARSDRARESSRHGERRERGERGERASGSREPAARRSAGSEDAGRGQAGAARRSSPDERRPEPVSALHAAPASAMGKPPPALEEEWYVSIDGEQEGPFSLAEAQHWVAQRPFDAELHCWSEGFDDWLPVDKVSHFRGLRKRPPPAALPPPLPRMAGISQRLGAITPLPAPVEDEPKPLFAATMASLERGAAVTGPGISLPRRVTPPPGTGIASRTNGAWGAAVPAAEPAAALDPRAPDSRGGVARPAVSPSSPSRVKSISESFDPGDSDVATHIAPIPSRDPILLPRRDEALAAEKHDRAGRDSAPGGSSLAGTGPKPLLAGPGPGPARSELESEGEDGDLAIGEVSRVVNLADIIRRPPAGDGPNTSRRSGTSRSTTSAGAAGMTADGTPGAPGEAGMAMAPAVKSHRRGLIALLSVAGVMVLGVTGALVLLVTTNDDPIGGKLGPVRDIDTSRPEDPITHRPLEPGATTPATPNPFVPRIPRPRALPGPPVGSNLEPLPGNSLTADEVEDVARKHQDITNRCYMRSQRGADSILIGDVKKIAVTLTVDSDGNVSDLKLSEHAADNLGKCLTMSMRSWKFRQSAGGTFRFSLNFVGS